MDVPLGKARTGNARKGWDLEDAAGFRKEETLKSPKMELQPQGWCWRQRETAPPRRRAKGRAGLRNLGRVTVHQA